MRIAYSVNAASPGDTLFNGGVVPAGYTAYVRARRYEIAGTFQTINSAYYLEDNWSITPNLLINAGIRLDAFNNKDGQGHSYIKMDDQWAPRFGFSWNMHGDGTTKLFGNLGRYFLPVANVINIKQAGGLLDQRTYYGFGGYRILQRNGSSYAVPILGVADRPGRYLAGRWHGTRSALERQPEYGAGPSGRTDSGLATSLQGQMVVGCQRYLPKAAQRDR